MTEKNKVISMGGFNIPLKGESVENKLDRPELGEKIYLELLLAKAIEDGDYKLTDQILALIPDEEEVRAKEWQLYQEHITTLEGLHEAKLEEVKREERERIITLLETFGINDRTYFGMWQALKEGCN